jgi:hypothetical protein
MGHAISSNHPRCLRMRSKPRIDPPNRPARREGATTDNVSRTTREA